MSELGNLSAGAVIRQKLKREHLLLEVGDIIKIEGEEGTWRVIEKPTFVYMLTYFALRELPGRRTYRYFGQEEADTKVKKLVEGPR